MLANPEKPPQIDWAYYQQKVAVPGLVDSFKKQYESLKVPYPEDKVSPQVDAQEKEGVRKFFNFNQMINELHCEMMIR